MHWRTTLVFSILVTAACAGSDEPAGTEQLTIVGDKNVSLDQGQTTTLAVRYEDATGSALMGEVEIEISGQVSDASLSADTAVTDEDGIARVTLSVGADGSFEVHAGAGDALPAVWSISVGGDGPTERRGAEGTYRLESRFDIVEAIPGDAGDVVQHIIALTDDDNDPAKYMIDQMLEQVDLGPVEGAIELMRWLIDPALNDVILSESPQALQDLLELGNQLGDMVESFAVVSTLDLKKTAADHELSGVMFSIGAQDQELLLADIGLTRTDPTAMSATISGDDRVELDRHPLSVPFGPVVIEAMNRVMIPAIAPGRANLGELLVELIDCGEAGELIAGYLPIIGSADAFTGACELGLKAGASAVEGQIQALAPDMVLEIEGAAKARDDDGDGRADRLTDGAWSGTLRIGDDDFDLGRAEFSGTRVR